jgi:hypothetical protein
VLWRVLRGWKGRLGLDFSAQNGMIQEHWHDWDLMESLMSECKEQTLSVFEGL